MSLSTRLLSPPLLAVDVLTDAGMQSLISALIYSLAGLGLFGIVWVILVKVSPFSLRKEIEEDQNTALGIILGALIIGMALIISAAIQG